VLDDRASAVLPQQREHPIAGMGDRLQVEFGAVKGECLGGGALHRRTAPGEGVCSRLEQQGLGEEQFQVRAPRNPLAVLGRLEAELGVERQPA
jgi:hypothetical protein